MQEKQRSWLEHVDVAKLFLPMLGLVASALSYAGLMEPWLSAVWITAMSLILVVYLRKNRLLLFISLVIAYACYSICYVNYFNPLSTTMYTSLSGTASAQTALSSLLLFLSVLLIFSPKKINEFGYRASIFSAKRGNTLVVAVISVALIFILVYAFGRPDSIGSDRGSPSPLYEYSIILFLVGFYCAGDKKSLKGILIVLIFMFAGQNLLYGGRVTALQLLMVFFFIFLSPRMTIRSILPLLSIVFALFVTVGNMRTGILGADIVDVFESVQDIFSRGFAWDTAYSSWHTSITFLMYGGMIDASEHLRLFGQWLLSVFLGGSVPGSGLAVITKSYFAHYYGGILPIFFQFYLGPFGVIAVAGCVAAIINWMNRTCGGIRSGDGSQVVYGMSVICTLYVTTTVFRWFLYSPAQITRGLILCALVSLIALWVDGQMAKSSVFARRTVSAKASSLEKNSDQFT
ncbi:hypothetical protein [Gordonibacter urolithinfaciens]|uniref:hypothetical protein n=1 Tax=Gordonibacter urolithinfaciens TaxID=1335613 RepID=UPI003A8EDB29